jgi:uncharacterized protein
MFFLKFRVPILIILTGITIFLGFGILKMTKENGMKSIMAADNKDYIFFEEMKEVFGATGEMVIGVTFSDSVYTKENLILIQNLSSFLENDEYIKDDDVLSISTIDNIDGIDQELIIEPIIPEDEVITNEIVQSVQDKIRDNDMLRGKIVSNDEKSTAIIVTMGTDIAWNAEKLALVINRTIKKIDEIETSRPDIEIYRSGMISVSHATSEYMDRDMKIMFPMAILVVMLILLIILRSFSGLVMPLLVTLFSVLWTMGLKGWIGSPLTVAETAIPIMLIAIGCADGVHIVSEYLSFQRDGLNPKVAITKTMKNLNTPVILTSITTSLGFLALISAPSVSIQNMGKFLGFGVLTAMLFSLLFIPALLSFKKEKTVKKSKKIREIDFTGIGKFIIRKRVIIVIASIGFLALSIVGMLKIEVETDQIEFLKDSDSLKIATKKLQESLGGVNSIDIIISGAEDTFKSPETLQFMHNLQIYAGSLESVGYSISLADYIKKIYYEFNDKDKSFNRIPENIEIIDGDQVPGQDIISSLLFLYEMGGGENLEKVVTDDYSMGKITIRLLDTTQIGIEKLVLEIQSWMDDNKPEDITIRYSNDYFRVVMGDLITEGQIRSFITTLIAIIILLIIIFKSAISGILTALPVVIAVCFNFAVMWLTGTTLNVGTSIIASVGMGVGIDYAIHFFQRYKNNYMETGDNYKSIILALNESATPIISNALAVGIGFLTLLFSNYYIIVGIGWITGLSMLTTAFNALFLLPAYLAIFEPLKQKKRKENMKKRMNKKGTVVAMFLLLSISLFAETSADEIMSINYDLKDPENSSNVTTMVLINSRGNKKIRKMEMFTMDTSIGEDTFIEFLLPADVRGTKFLTIGNDQADDEQRLFLPALKRVRKISSSNKNGKFMGSDITYYDMESRNLEDFTYKLLREDTVGNRSCWVIESTPVDEDSPYSKVFNYVSMDNYFTYKNEMYDENGELIKTVTVVETQVIHGVIIPIKTVFDNIEDDHKTLLSISNIKLDSNIDESKFTVQNLR